MQKAYQKREHEIYLENEAGERIAEIGACSAGDSGAGRNGYGDLFVCPALAGEAHQIKPPLSWEIIRRLIRIGTGDVPVRMILYCIQRSTRPIRLS